MRPQRFGRLEVYIQLDLGRLLHRQVGGLLAFKNSTGVAADLTVKVGVVAAVTHQAAGGGEVAVVVNCRHAVALRQRAELLASSIEERVAADDHRASPEP